MRSFNLNIISSHTVYDCRRWGSHIPLALWLKHKVLLSIRRKLFFLLKTVTINVTSEFAFIHICPNAICIFHFRSFNNSTCTKHSVCCRCLAANAMCRCVHVCVSMEHKGRFYQNVNGIVWEIAYLYAFVMHGALVVDERTTTKPRNYFTAMKNENSDVD